MSDNQDRLIGRVGKVTAIHDTQEAIELKITPHDDNDSESWWFHPHDLTEVKKIVIKKEKFNIKNLVVPL
jgi:hypothetical protein